MTVADSQRLRTVAQQIADASAPEVLANINQIQKEGKNTQWVADATKAINARFGGVSQAMRQPVEEEVQPAGDAMRAGEPPGAGGPPPLGAGGPVQPPPVTNDETIVFAVGTPVFLVQNSAIDIDSARAEATAWRQILSVKAPLLNRSMASIGRVDVSNFDNPFVGTAWVIDDGLVVTNRHVASLFAQTSGAGFTFRVGFDARTPVAADIDFLQEYGNAATDPVAVDRVVWIAPDGLPDIAFLKLAQAPSAVGRVILELASDPPPAKLPVAVVGYPASDIRFSDQQLANKIFGGIYDKKRVAVGNLLGIGDDNITHSCATLGGNSGSPLIDIGTGQVVALHYRGIEFVENDAIPIEQLKRCLARARGLLENTGGTTMADNSSGSGNQNSGRSGITFTVPLKITVEIDGSAMPTFAAAATGGPGPAPAFGWSQGSAQQAGSGSGPNTAAPPAGSSPPDREMTLAAVRAARALLANREDVVAVKPGYRFENGAITDQRAVVIAVKRKVDLGALESRGVMPLPSYVNGVRTDITVASTADLMGLSLDDEAPATWHTSYKKRPDLPLLRRNTSTTFTLHTGPDASWPVLGPFLAETTKSLVVAMYDFGAINVLNGVLDAVKNKAETISLVLQMGGKVHTGDFTDYEAVDKIREEKGSKFSFAPASVGKGGIFDSAYHIKVAVRDHSAMWLSSGNWQSSNQPDVAPLTNPADANALRLYNREWHVVLEDKDLSQLFEAHILRDLEEAKAAPEAVSGEPLVWVPADLAADEAVAKPRYFQQVTDTRSIDVQPVLTPDNYIDVVLPFIQSAKSTIYFQNQSFNTKTVGDDYRKLLDALLAQQKAGREVRIIFRSFGPDDRDTISNAKDYGFDTTKIRKQNNCHTKGIIVDGEAVLVGSHNWTTAGTGFNRDASLIFYDRDIAKFYQDVFLYDWDRIGPTKIDESLPMPIIVTAANDTTPHPGYVAVPLSQILGR
ncbi:phospholipase D-like domain-containing protein [Mesorhizobium sp. VK4C]|uniref:phospholipase D-like domain-containing protein n=1 Tax=Mesorhizobium captivum TaxID=3072319 RepID=UPI002A24DBF5|nr:phospholipase D-like domain-containing protein [Mesorhizobium sp. VK4C]MDX8501802.1 phospholipase D-like domain-containing protein [Mesorhizobium sp. VK4C]